MRWGASQSHCPRWHRRLTWLLPQGRARSQKDLRSVFPLATGIFTCLCVQDQIRSNCHHQGHLMLYLKGHTRQSVCY